VIDAGPFGDIASLSIFEQALGHIPGTEDVYVRAFEGNRAHVDLTLGTPVSLVGQLRKMLPLAFTVAEASAERLVLNIDQSASTAAGA
jgi:hypothetical protein